MTAVERMRRNIGRHMTDRVEIVREDTVPEDWQIDDATGDILGTDQRTIWSGPASIAAPTDRGIQAIDQITVKIPALVETIRRSDRLEILQSDDTALIGTAWVVSDVDYGTHRVSRTLTCAKAGRAQRIGLDT